jgi:hypothetical protein
LVTLAHGARANIRAVHPCGVTVPRRLRHVTLPILLAFVAAAAAVSAWNSPAQRSNVQRGNVQRSNVQRGNVPRSNVQGGNAASVASWLDRPLTGWNKPGAAVPSPAQKPSQPAALMKRCSLTSPTQAGAAAVAAAGWVPYLHQDRALARDGVEVVGGLADASTACDPLGFHLFVFVNGRFAGTLSPAPMTTSRDGAAGAVRLTSADSLTTEFARFAPGDLECCPSTRVRVTYRIDRGKPPTIVATSVQVLR